MSEMMRHTLVELRICSEPQFLELMRSVIRQLSQIVGFSQWDANMITLAVGEACTNVICHTYENRPDCQMTIGCRRLADGLEIVLQDTGPKVQQSQLQPRSLEDVKPGGLGLHFIHSVMDRVKYDPEYQEGNRLIMIKKFNPEPASRPSS